jgi:tRNA (cmo5U34)-methyltransferase
MSKSTVDQIRERFDKDVERFSNLETGQSATMDAPLVLDLISAAAAAYNRGATAMLDIGCGAGNYTLKLLEKLPGMAVTLVDLSRPMLDRASQRIQASHPGIAVTALQGDIREIELGANRFDVITAAAVFHHLRTDEEWRSVFGKLFTSLKPGGSVWISDLVTHTLGPVQQMMWERYGDYLRALKDEAYRAHVFEYIAYEDTPRPLTYQLDLLRQAGFAQTEVLHKNSCFAAFGAVKASA